MYITIINILMFIISISIAIIIIIIIIIIITIAVATISIVSHDFWRHTFAHVFYLPFTCWKAATFYWNLICSERVVSIEMKQWANTFK